MLRREIIKIYNDCCETEIKRICTYALQLQELLREARPHMDRWNQDSNIARKVSALVRRDVDGV